MRYQKTLLSFDVNVYTASPRAYLSTQGTKKTGSRLLRRTEVAR
jgi:hypothetical protein